MSLTDADRESLRGLGQGQVPAVVDRIVAEHVARAVTAALTEASRAVTCELGSSRARGSAAFTDGLMAADRVIRNQRPT